MREQKAALSRAIRDGESDEIADLLRAWPGGIRTLLSGLHQRDESDLSKVLMAFRVAAKVCEREHTLDLCRRLMWMLNEESGNNCPNAALALAAIAEVDPEAVRPHLPVLRLYAADPSSRMRTIIQRALAEIENLPDILRAEGGNT